MSTTQQEMNKSAGVGYEMKIVLLDDIITVTLGAQEAVLTYKFLKKCLKSYLNNCIHFS